MAPVRKLDVPAKWSPNLCSQGEAFVDQDRPGLGTDCSRTEALLPGCGLQKANHTRLVLAQRLMNWPTWYRPTLLVSLPALRLQQNNHCMLALPITSLRLSIRHRSESACHDENLGTPRHPFLGPIQFARGAPQFALPTGRQVAPLSDHANRCH